MKNYFISYIHEEVIIASFIHDYLNDLFQQEARFFLSADSIMPGEDWLKRVRSEIDDAQGLLTLLSNESFYRPWINIETGAFWINERAIFPLNYGGLKLSHLHRPLSDMQITYLEDANSISLLIRALSKHIGLLTPPSYDAKNFCDDFGEIYNNLIKVCSTFSQIISELNITAPSTPQLLDSITIVEESSYLSFSQKNSGTVQISGYVSDTAVLIIKSEFTVSQQKYLVLELENTERSSSLAFGQMLKIRLNNELLLPVIKQQQHPLDSEYMRIKDGFYAYELNHFSKNPNISIELVFWKIALDKLRLRFYII